MAWDEEDTTIYKVVVNHEEQYSIWPEFKEIPGGWRSVEMTGSKTAMSGLHKRNMDRYASFKP